MKKALQIAILALVLMPMISKSQMYEKYEGNNMGWSMTINAGPSIFFGDLKQNKVVPVSKYNNEWSAGGSFIVSKKLFSFLSIRAQYLKGNLAGTKREYSDGSPANMYFKTNYNEYNMNFKLDISEFFKPEEERKTTFYTYAGIGLFDFRTKKYDLRTNRVIGRLGYDENNKKTEATTETVMPLGIGLEYNLTYNIGLVIDYSKRIVNSDKIDMTIGKSKYDVYDYLSFGITYNFRGPKDSDKDGVPDKTDRCAATPAGIEITEFGCPKDVDGDSIPDYLDKCPKAKGLAQFNGCPDTDADGIQDSEDKCPQVKGLIQFAGCPDTDEDGIEDSKDSCVNEKGLAQFGGCPDTDGDGIPDKRDRCPKAKGTVAFKGCPDSDNDGVADIDDKCPQVAGILTNMGCPAVKKEVLKVFEKAMTGIQFETGKDVILKTSFPILDQVVKAMVENQTYNLEINGHTDNVGDNQKNLVLSQKRADAVKKYITSKGVVADRMKSTGFGSTMPIADNATKEGKAKNRRVEFKVVFQTVELEEVK